MKKIYTLCFALLMASATFAQNKLNIVIFSEDGEPFFAYVNGIRQNQTAETNIRITDLTTESFHFRIVFANSGNEPLTKDQYLPFGSEYTFKIKKAKKGLKLAPFGQVALTESTSTAPSYAYTTTENTGTTNNTANSINQNNNNNTANTTVATTGGTTGTTTQTSETITTTTTVNAIEPNKTNTGTTGENVNFNMNVSENGMNVNMNVSGTGTNSTNGTTANNSATISVNGTGTNNTSTNTTGTTTTTYTTTTTTTTSSSGTTGYDQNTYNNNTNTNTNTNNNNYNNNAYNTTSSTSCYYPMTDADFTKMKTSVESKTYQDVMMTTAKQATKNNCLNVAQIGEVMKLFMMDEDKLVYAKYAYDYCTEKQNYYQLADELTYSGTQEDFNAWLDKK